ncbi:MAG TPA: DUF4142 domain-containing protein [Chthoniobacteraceae bacterium]|nr:DUF4142 domain-containing protein [Chthoniobacteraceae bacterium]
MKLSKIYYPVCTGLIALGMSSTGLQAASHTGQQSESSQTPGVAAPGTTEAFTAPGEAKETAALNHQDIQFIQQAVEKNLEGTLLGLLGIQKGSTSDVRKYGDKLVDESIKANKELMELAQKKHILIPMDQLKLPTEELNRLSKQEGKEFDTALVMTLFNDGQARQSQLQQSLAGIQDREIRSLADRMLATTGHHLAEAKKLGSKVGIDEKALEAPPVGEGPLLPKQGVPAPSPGLNTTPGSQATPSPLHQPFRPMENEPKSEI